MSDTPRTDSQLLTVKDCSYVAPHPTGEYVYAEFARQLERENAALRSIASAMAAEMEQHGGDQAFESLARYRAALGEDKP